MFSGIDFKPKTLFKLWQAELSFFTIPLKFVGSSCETSDVFLFLSTVAAVVQLWYNIAYS